MRIALLMLVAIVAPAQDLRITASTLSRNSTSAMFGRLPKAYESAAVGVCNQTAVAQTVPLVRIAQQLKLTQGITLLPHDVALSVISTAQGGSGWAKAFRWSVATVELTAIAASWAGLSPAWKAALNDSALAGGQAISIFSTAIPNHNYLTFDHITFPDILQLPALGCLPGIQIIERNPSVKNIDFVMTLPGALPTVTLPGALPGALPTADTRTEKPPTI